ncbi:hypothetical protein J6590_090620 [Homalodisca vitripennis]|nr:hypothetical protein J6590_090620 [Homalodisca vitripennis]
MCHLNLGNLTRNVQERHITDCIDYFWNGGVTFFKGSTLSGEASTELAFPPSEVHDLRLVPLIFPQEAAPLPPTLPIQNSCYSDSSLKYPADENLCLDLVFADAQPLSSPILASSLDMASCDDRDITFTPLVLR